MGFYFIVLAKLWSICKSKYWISVQFTPVIDRQTVVVVTGGFSNKRIIYAAVVNFLSQVIFIFPLFLGMVIYANEFGQKKNKNYLSR